jgi:hypothetical protein
METKTNAYTTVRSMHQAVDPPARPPIQPQEPPKPIPTAPRYIYKFTASSVHTSFFDDASGIGREVWGLIRKGVAIECFAVHVSSLSQPFYLVRVSAENRFTAAYEWCDTPKWYRLLADAQAEADAWLHWPFMLLQV